MKKKTGGKMKIKILITIISLCYCFSAFGNDEVNDKEKHSITDNVNPLAANGFNYISLGLEIGPTLNRARSFYPVHYGLPVKVYLGRKKQGRLILRTGIHYFPAPSLRNFNGVKRAFQTIIPLGIGYRRNFDDWYVEGSVGAALTTEANIYQDPSLSKSQIVFREINYGIEIGKQLGDFDVGLAVYNTGPIPFHILYAGVKTSYRIKW